MTNPVMPSPQLDDLVADRDKERSGADVPEIFLKGFDAGFQRGLEKLKSDGDGSDHDAFLKGKRAGAQELRDFLLKERNWGAGVMHLIKETIEVWLKNEFSGRDS